MLVKAVMESLQFEKNELDIKIDKLEAFFLSPERKASVNEIQLELLAKQLEIMQAYSKILALRIADLQIKG